MTAAIFQLSVGNWPQVKSVGRGVFERYRIYFGKDGETLVVLLGGSTKERQYQAVQAAQSAAQKHNTDLAGRYYGPHTGI